MVFGQRYQLQFCYYFVNNSISMAQATTRYQISISHHVLVTHQLQQQAKPQQQQPQLQQQQVQVQVQQQLQPQPQQQTIQQTIANINTRDNNGE